MNPGSMVFAAERGVILSASDDELLPIVQAALLDREAGAEDWWEPVAVAAGVLWLETYEAEAGSAPPDEALETFVATISASLEQTTGTIATETQASRVTQWTSTYSVNAATASAAGAGGWRLEWVTMRDDDVRDVHRPLDGTRIDVGGTFDVGGFALSFPGEPVGPPEIWIECRCVAMPVRREDEEMAPTPTDVAAARQRIADLLPTALTAKAETEDAALVAAPPVDVDVDVEPAQDDVDEDAPEWDDDLEIDVPWHGILAVEDNVTGDRRKFRAGGLSTDVLPLPLTYQKAEAEGHDGAVVVGNIARAERLEDGSWKASGMLRLSAEGDEVIDLLATEMMRGVSVALDEVTLSYENDDGTEFNPASAPDGAMPIRVVEAGRIRSATVLPIAAFSETFVALGPWPEDEEALVAAGECLPCLAREMDALYDDLAAYAISDKAWDGSASRFTDDEWRRATVVDRGDEFDTAKTRYAVPIREPNGDLSRAAVHNAAARIDQVDAPPAALAAGRRRLLAAYRQLNEDPPESLVAAALEMSDQVVDAYAPGTRDGPGWITHPEDTQRLRRYWTRGKGAAKIRWGQPGDFNRCRRQLAKYVPNPHYLAGTCANLHKVALGVWPGQETGRHALQAGAEIPPSFTVEGIAPSHVPPAAWFVDPELDGPTPLTVDESGRIYGHLALWDTCHTGYGISVGDGELCVSPPTSPSGYAYARVGSLLTDDGLVDVGHITIGTGHAAGKLAPFPAAAHYDNTGTVAADVALGEDDHGIWFAGAVRPDTDVQALRSAVLSGDWRSVHGKYELVAALAVNVPGFPVPRTAVTASADRPLSLVAAGIVPRPEPVEVVDIPAIVRETLAQMRAEEDRKQRSATVRSRLHSLRVAHARERIASYR